MEELFPRSSFFEVRNTENGAGRGVFALRHIGKGTVLLGTSTIVSRTIYSEYVKEVCAQCFAYDRGKVWRIRDNAKGLVFCSQYCAQEWQTSTLPDAGIARIELKKFLSRRKAANMERDDFDQPDPSPGIIDKVWEAGEKLANTIRKARAATQPTREMRRAIETAKAITYPDATAIWYIFEGCLYAASDPKTWACVENLVADEKPYKAHELAQHVEAYTLLLATLPISLVPFITQKTVRTLQSRSVHNVFSIRSLDEGGREGDAGSEFLGYGLWPLASFWNHSCEPNMQKIRRGKTWTFYACRDISPDEELCITYLGGDERDMSINERRTKLKEGWGFHCICAACCAGTS